MSSCLLMPSDLALAYTCLYIAREANTDLPAAVAVLSQALTGGCLGFVLAGEGQALARKSLNLAFCTLVQCLAMITTRGFPSLDVTTAGIAAPQFLIISRD